MVSTAELLRRDSGKQEAFQKGGYWGKGCLPLSSCQWGIGQNSTAITRKNNLTAPSNICIFEL